MKKKALALISFLVLISFSDSAKSSNGIYLSLFNNPRSLSFNNISLSQTDKPYIKGIFSGTFSIYRDNALEFNISLLTSKYHQSGDKYLSDYALGFEFGKLFSFEIESSKNQRILAPDLSAGVFFKMDMLKPENSLKLYYSYGLYLGLKIKFSINLKKIKSIDLGYKYSLPMYFSFQNDESHTIITNNHAIFVGISLL